MKIFDIVKDFALTNANKLLFSVKSNSPTLLMIGGAGCVLGATALAIAKTDKASEALDEFNEQMDRYHKSVEIADARDDSEEFYPLEERKHHVRLIYGHMIMSMAKIYLPVVVLEVAGIFMLCKSHQILNKRNALLASSYAALQKSYNDYRKRVRDKYGEDAEKEIFYGTSIEKIMVKETSENGVTTEKEVENVNVDPLSPWSFFIDETCTRVWSKDPHQTRLNLMQVERQLNDMAYYRPFVTLNDLYWLVGHELTDEGLVNGWEGGKDVHISLGFDDINRPATRRFINGLENVVLLTPNIDGNIYQMSKERKKRADAESKVLLHSRCC